MTSTRLAEHFPDRKDIAIEASPVGECASPTLAFSVGDEVLTIAGLEKHFYHDKRAVITKIVGTSRVFVTIKEGPKAGHNKPFAPQMLRYPSSTSGQTAATASGAGTVAPRPRLRRILHRLCWGFEAAPCYCSILEFCISSFLLRNAFAEYR